MAHNDGIAKQDAITALARMLGWKVVTFFAVETKRGWRTPAGGDATGWPDLLLLHPAKRRLMVREVKSGRGRLTAAQSQWIVWLRAAGVDADTWYYDEMHGRILKELKAA